MANRSMLAKAGRAKAQARELALAEYSKPAWHRHETIGAANAKRAELAALVASFKGPITVCPAGKPVPAVGKSKRSFITRCYGDGRRRGSVLTPDVYAKL